ncbi:MAG: prepilin-type N-terminal cleavage/methylation domain-containing protein, partial [Selenomonadaceae bacterium]|nr:prepilin-type N-terminal cleavage/methylation domain-containing protein [Selenomonadaceae bacterium]
MKMRGLGERGFTMLEVLITVTLCGVSTLETTTYIVKAFEFQCFYPHYR